MKDLVNWALGILILLIMGSFGYTRLVLVDMTSVMDKVEVRFNERLDKIDRKLDKLLERR